MIKYILFLFVIIATGCVIHRSMDADITGNNIFVPPYATVGAGHIHYNATTEVFYGCNRSNR